jgi:hypothetical protein
MKQSTIGILSEAMLNNEEPNQALERNAYVRHAGCVAAIAPATGVAHL